MDDRELKCVRHVKLGVKQQLPVSEPETQVGRGSRVRCYETFAIIHS